MIWRLALIATLAACPAGATDLRPPGGAETARLQNDVDSVRLPQGPFDANQAISAIEGTISRYVYTIPNSSLTTLQIISPAREDLEDMGFVETFTCSDESCGGFDFRFQLDLIQAPDMYVDLGDFRYSLLESFEGNPHTIALLASRSSATGYLHVTEVSKVTQAKLFRPNDETSNAAPQLLNQNNSQLIQTLIETGYVVLGDLDFAVGSSDLGPGPFRSLDVLTSWLQETPGARVVLVGHTDAVGSLEANKSLSRQRALSVLERLTDGLGANASQVAADGAGALSPMASNLDSEGRAANRRVEVVLLSLE